MKTFKFAPLALAGFLQVAPFAPRLLPPAALASPMVAVVRWVIGAFAVAGTYDVVSAASAVLASANAISGTVGTRLSYQIKISDGQTRRPESWEVAGHTYRSSGSTTAGLPPGLSLSLTTGIISGIPTQGGVFDVSITAYEHPNRTGASLAFTLKFTITGGASLPAITAQPSGGTALEGSSFSFVVAASGDGLSYEWQHNGATIPGATSATFTLDSVQLSDAGDYMVRVTNPGGSVTSSTATLKVTAQAVGPSITAQPLSVAVHAGEPLQLTVTATGPRGMTYQWQHGGTDLPGQTGPSLTVASVTEADAGTYEVVISASDAKVTSAPATVTVLPLTIGLAGRTPDGVKLTIHTIPGQRYVVEATGALESGSWATVTDTVAQSEVLTWVDPYTSTGKRFWRCHVVP